MPPHLLHFETSSWWQLSSGSWRVQKKHHQQINCSSSSSLCPISTFKLSCCLPFFSSHYPPYRMRVSEAKDLFFLHSPPIPTFVYVCTCIETKIQPIKTIKRPSHMMMRFFFYGVYIHTYIHTYMYYSIPPPHSTPTKQSDCLHFYITF